MQHSRTEYSRQYELAPWTRQRSPVGERRQDPPADAVPEGPITSKALRENICQRGTPGIPKACAMVPMMWLPKAYRPEGRPWPQRLNLSPASVSNAWDASSALLLKQAGFRALGTSSPPIAARYDGQIHPGPVGFRGNRQAPRCVHPMSVRPLSTSPAQLDTSSVKRSSVHGRKKRKSAVANGMRTSLAISCRFVSFHLCPRGCFFRPDEPPSQDGC